MDPHERSKHQGVSLLILIFLILTAVIVTASRLYYQSYLQHFRTQVEHQLSAIAELKVNELARYRKERWGDATFFYQNFTFSALVQRYFEQPEDREIQNQLRTWLNHFQTSKSYERVMLLDAQYTKRMIEPEGPERTTSLVSPSNSESLRSGKIVFEDFYWNEENQHIYLKILVPLLFAANDNRLLGVIALRIDPEQYLYPLLQRWPTPSQTAETLLLRREGNDVLYLNELRFQKGAALTLRLPLESNDVPAVKAALGQEGIVEGRDYRGVPVIAVVRTVPDSPWFLVARMDTAEVYAPIRERIWIIGVVVGILLLGSGAGVGLVWRQQSARFHQERHEAAEKLRDQEQKHRALYNNIGVGVAMISPNMEVLALNHRMQKWFPETNLEQRPLCHQEFNCPPRDEACLDCPTHLTLKDGQLHEAEVKISTPNGIRCFRNVSTAIIDAQGKVESAIEMLDDITERKRIEEAQLFLLQCGSLGSGEDFFESLARYLAKSLGMDYVCIDRLQGDEHTAQTVAIYFDGKFEDNVEYALKDTPCGDVVGKTICCFPQDVRHLFPQDVVLQEMMAECYVGTTLWSFDGKPIGLIAVIGRKPLVNPYLVESVLKLVAIRAAGELERKAAEEALHRLASVDELTGISNRRVFIETAGN
ncbi:MAG: PAS domain S-box protein [Candidatus Atribacteria bacterium]|nr:PAS domain S-box protein [Candidatus Atribacteria bacterium]